MCGCDGSSIHYLYLIMKLGPAALDALREEVNGRLCCGDELVAVGCIALQATEQLVQEHKEELEQYFSPSFLRDAHMLGKRFGLTEPVKNGEIWKLAEEKGASARIEINEDGFLAGLWKIAEVSDVGLHADLRKIPIRQETIEICERYDVNPYEAASGKVMLAGFGNAYSFMEECRKRGIPAVVIGNCNSENARLLYSGETCRYLDRPRKKEKL